LIKQYISTRYSFVQQRLTPRRLFKHDLAAFLQKNKVHLTQGLWKWTIVYLKDDSAYRKLKLQKSA
jgi:hypothetical protein